MARLGFLYAPGAGHLNPLAGLGRELSRRGHEVAFFHLPEFESDARDRGLNFVPFGHSPQPCARERFRALAGLHGAEAMSASLELTRLMGQAALNHAAPVLRRWRPDLLLIDQMDYAASTLAQLMGIPYVTVAVTLLRQDEEGIPGFDGRPYRASEVRPRPAALLGLFADLEKARLAGGLGPFSYETLWSRLAQISQQPPEFEYPRQTLPKWFHFTGPFAAAPEAAPRPRRDFPWNRLDGRPLIYASLGTVVAGKALLEKIVAAVQSLDVQLVLVSPDPLDGLPETAVQVRSAPQLEILRKASAMVTHAGMNSTLECLAAGVPMLALPLAHDQPGVACRIAWSGVGLSLDPEERDVERMRLALREILGNSTYREAARGMQQRIARNQGLARACDIVERVLETGKPFPRGNVS